MRRFPFVYGAAHGGKTLFWAASDLYFAFYMNEVCGIAPAITGAIVGASVLFAALADLGIGRRVSRRASSARRAASLQLIGAGASSAALLLFAAIAFVPSDWQIIGAVTTLFLFRIAYALIDIPQNAMLALVSGPPPQRTALVAARNIAGGIARVSLAAAFVPIMNVRTPEEGASRFLILVTVVTIGAVGSAVVLARAISDDVTPPARLSDGPSTVDLSGHLIRMAFASAILTAVVQLEPYLATRGIADRMVGTVMMTAVAAGTIISQPFWRFQAETARTRLWSQALGAIAVAGLALLLLPLQSASGAGVAGLIYGIATGGLLFALWSAFTETIPPETAFAAFARFTAAAKVGQGCATMAVGLLIQHYHTASAGGPHSFASFAMGGILLIGVMVLYFLRSRPKPE